MKKSFLKYLGAIMVIIGAIVLICSYFFGWTNINNIQFFSFGFMIIGLVIYIIVNKYIKE